MPEFCNPFTVLKHERKLTHEELVRAIRFIPCGIWMAALAVIHLTPAPLPRILWHRDAGLAGRGE